MGDDRNDWLDTALLPLKASHHDHTWSSTEDVQHRGRRRRQRRMAAISGGGGLAIAVVLIVALMSSSSGTHTRGPVGTALPGLVQAVAGPDGSVHLVADVTGTPKHVNNANISAVASAEVQFAIRLTREELSQSPTTNVLLSPMSADIDLAMLELGSAGATAHEVGAALQSSGLSSSDQAEGWSGLVRQLMAAESSGELHLASSLWVDNGLTVQPQFLRQAAATFGEDTYQVGFSKSSATQAINAWVDQETAGRIKQLYLPGDLSGATELVLANALHFRAAWQHGLFAAATPSSGRFYPAGGAPVTVPVLDDEEDTFLATKTPSYSVVQLPYTNGRFAALLVEPTPGTMTSFLPKLTAAYLASLTASLRHNVVDFSMPLLHLSARESLDQPLSAMGMAQAFEEADFSPMLGAVGGTNQAVGGVEQAATLDVAQWGTDAAAATGVSVVPSATRVAALTISFDHPYVLLIRDNTTGTILFSSVVNNPSAG
jgi:serpin B